MSRFYSSIWLISIFTATLITCLQGCTERENNDITEPAVNNISAPLDVGVSLPLDLKMVLLNEATLSGVVHM